MGTAHQLGCGEVSASTTDEVGGGLRRVHRLLGGLHRRWGGHLTRQLARCLVEVDGLQG